jgi:hypothetical protein
LRAASLKASLDSVFHAANGLLAIVCMVPFSGITLATFSMNERFLIMFVPKCAGVPHSVFGVGRVGIVTAEEGCGLRGTCYLA